MPKYYCNYCDTYLTHDSPSVRKTHCTGRKHKDNVKFYYQKWMEKQAQNLIDATTAAFKAGKIANNPFAQVAKGIAIPPPTHLAIAQRPPGPGTPGIMLPATQLPMMLPTHCPVSQMMGLHPQMMNMIPVGPMPHPASMAPLPPNTVTNNQ